MEVRGGEELAGPEGPFQVYGLVIMWVGVEVGRSMWLGGGAVLRGGGGGAAGAVPGALCWRSLSVNCWNYRGGGAHTCGGAGVCAGRRPLGWARVVCTSRYLRE